MPKFQIEVTDTFAGEANYCWVKRETIEVPEYNNRRIAQPQPLAHR